MEPSAVAARRTRASLALAVGGALFLMSGIALALTGAALGLEHQAHPVHLVAPGLVLAVLGLSLGASAMVAALLDAPSRMPPPQAGPWPADVAGAVHAAGAGGAARAARLAAAAQAAGAAHGSATVAGQVLSSFALPERPRAAPVPPPEVVPGAPLRPPGRHRPGPVPAAREPAAGEMRADQVRTGEVRTGEVPRGEVLAGYSDAGWSIELD